jgi:DNA-binding transcriptional ArsR family regulator
MVKYSLDDVFSALADPTRRGIVAALASGPRAVSELARPYAMSLPGFMKHLGILEGAGLLEREKNGRVVQCALSPDPMKEATAWLERYSKFWDERLDALGRYLEKENDPCPQSPKSPRSRSSGPTRRRRKRSGAR